MSVDLAAFRTRLQVLLNDPDADIWSVSLLEECLRAALRELQGVCPIALQIVGLDDALETTVDQELLLSPLILQIAQGYALTQRQVQRSESFHPDPAKQINTLCQPDRLQDLKAEVERVRLLFLQRSLTTPY
jgi:hypothetical protein